MDLTGNMNIRPGGIDDMMKFLVSEYLKGNLRDEENSIDEFAGRIQKMLNDNAEDKNFVDSTRNLFNDVKDVKPYSPDDNEDFKDNENIPSEK